MKGQIYSIAALVVGALVASQGVVNAMLGRTLDHPLQATFMNFAVGTMVALIVLYGVGVGLPGKAAMARAPWYLYLGGVLGVIFVTGILLLIPKLGAAGVVMAVFVGQMVTAMVIDHFGLLGVGKIAFSPQRVMGAGLMLAGLYVIQWKPGA